MKDYNDPAKAPMNCLALLIFLGIILFAVYEAFRWIFKFVGYLLWPITWLLVFLYRAIIETVERDREAEATIDPRFRKWSYLYRCLASSVAIVIFVLSAQQCWPEHKITSSIAWFSVALGLVVLWQASNELSRSE